MEMEVSFDTKIELDDEDKKDDSLPLMIKGMSVRGGYIKSKHFIIPHKELSNIAKTLREGVDGKGAYFLKDHGYQSAGLMAYKSVDKLIGRVSNAFKRENQVNYEARIETKDDAFKIRRGLVTASSAGLRVKKAYCSICGRDYGDPECNHKLGKEYPEEGLHASVEQYLDEMGGVPKAAIVGKDISATEQSIVLFPAIKGAKAEPFGLNFSEETEKFIGVIEMSKQGTIDDPGTDDLDSTDLVSSLESITGNDDLGCDCDDAELDATQIIKNLASIGDTFNKDMQTITVRGNKMSEEKLAEMAQEIEDLKAEKDTLTAKIATLEEANARYKAEEEKRHKAWREGMISKLNDIRKDKGFPERDYSEVSDEVLTWDLETLESFASAGTRGQAGDDSDDAVKEKHKTDKAAWKEKIFSG